jgi:hypothetical protein
MLCCGNSDYINASICSIKKKLELLYFSLSGVCYLFTNRSSNKKDTAQGGRGGEGYSLDPV